MIADIRIRSDGNSRSLCQLDLMRFSEEQVRERMRVRGIEDDAFLFAVLWIGKWILSCP